MPEELLAKAVTAKHDRKGARYARQQLYAALNLGIHALGAPEPMARSARMEAAMPLRHVPARCTRLASAMSPLAAAPPTTASIGSKSSAPTCAPGWAVTLLSAVIGARNGNTILANGGQRPPQDPVRDFLGRDSNSKVFFADVAR